MWKEIEIKSWEDYNKVAIKLSPKKWIFRGQSDTN